MFVRKTLTKYQTKRLFFSISRKYFSNIYKLSNIIKFRYHLNIYKLQAIKCLRFYPPFKRLCFYKTDSAKCEIYICMENNFSYFASTNRASLIWIYTYKYIRIYPILIRCLMYSRNVYICSNVILNLTRDSHHRRGIIEKIREDGKVTTNKNITGVALYRSKRLKGRNIRDWWRRNYLLQNTDEARP